MQLRIRVGAAAAAVFAMASAAAVTPGIAAPSSAAPPEGVHRAAPADTPACQTARDAWTAARTAQRRAHRAVVKARRHLRSVREQHRPAAIKKAKRQLRRARHRYQAAVTAATSAADQMAVACDPTTQADAIGQALKLLVGSTGALSGPLDLTQLTTLLDQLLPGVSDLLSPDQLTALLDGFGTGDLSLDDASALLGDAFTLGELQSVLDGTAGPDLVLDVVDEVLGQLADLGGLPVPGDFDPTDLLETIAGLFGNLDPTQLGGLLDLLLSIGGAPGTNLDPADLTALLDSLIPGLSDLVGDAELTSLLDALNGASLDPATISNLLGGQFTPEQITAVLGGTADPELIGEVLATVVAQLGTLSGGQLELPGSLDPAVLLDLLDSITQIVDDLLGGLLGGGDSPICTLLPFLC